MKKILKLYETYDFRKKETYWWTQRDRNTNCYEIRKLSISKKFCLYINEIAKEEFDTFNEAERRIKELWAA